jgi:hypothetical protein
MFATAIWMASTIEKTRNANSSTSIEDDCSYATPAAVCKKYKDLYTKCKVRSEFVTVPTAM